MYSVPLQGKPQDSDFPDRACVACGNETDSTIAYRGLIPKRQSARSVLTHLALTLLVVNGLFLPGLTLKGHMPFGFALFVFSVLGTAAFFTYRTFRSAGGDTEAISIRVFLCDGCQKARPVPSRAGGFLFLLGIASLLVGLFGSSNGMRFMLAFVCTGLTCLLLAFLVASIRTRGRRSPLSFQRRGDHYFVTVYNKGIADRIVVASR